MPTDLALKARARRLNALDAIAGRRTAETAEGFSRRTAAPAALPGFRSSRTGSAKIVPLF